MGYFHQVNESTPTRVWVNNPTLADATRSVDDGAIACTTNPTYGAKVLDAESAECAPVIAEAARRYHDAAEAAEWAQRELVRRILPVFLPLHEKDPVRQGWVSIQGDPTAEEDPARIVSSMRAARSLGPNVIAKVPVTASGLAAIETLAADGMPIIATEVMAVAQARAALAAFQRGARRARGTPVLYVTHITGILEQHLVSAAARDCPALSRDDIARAALAIAHRQLDRIARSGVPARMLGGGARGIHHFTGMVGRDMDVTINWAGTADELLKNPPPVETLEASLPAATVERLRGLLPDFARAWDDDGLPVDRFADFGPVVLFKGMFVDGWNALIAAIRARS